MAAPEAATEAAGTAEAPLDLAPAPAPSNIVARGTWRVPSKALDAISAWLQPGLDWRAALAGPLEELVNVLDFEAPIDLVVTLNAPAGEKPRALFAVAAGLTSRQAAIDAFRGRGGPVDFVEPGVYSVQLTPRTPCFVAAALGPSSARLVCSENRESLEALSPYLTRGEPSKAALPSNLSVEVLAEPLWKRFGPQAEMLKSWLPLAVGELPLGNEALAASLNVAARSVADEALLFAGDLSRVRLEMDVRPDQEALELSLATDYHSARSWLAQGAVTSAGRASIAPEAFWALPAEATSAAYTAPTDPVQSEGILRVLGELSDGALRHVGATAAERDAWLAALNKANQLEGPWVSAHGSVPPAFAAKPIDAVEAERLRTGYQLLGVKDDADVVGPLLERSLRLYNDAALRRGLSQRFSVEPARLLKVSDRRGTQGKVVTHTYEVLVPRELYNRSLQAAGAAPAKGAPIPVVVITARDAPWTWIGFSSYEKLLDERLRTLYDPRARQTTLQARPGLDALKAERATSAGFFSLSGLISAFPLEGDERPWDLLASLPNQGQTPVVFHARTTPEGPHADLRFSLPKAVFQDLGAALFR